VAGVRGHASGPPAQTSLPARLVAGAEGLHSTVARTVAARAYRSHPPLTAVCYSCWSGISHLGASFHARPGRPTWPTNDNLTCIDIAWPHQEFRQVRTYIEGCFRAARSTRSWPR
jgi:2-polyprenyl-6-methoxyphenol hydroxylase-like FAD-dependent oxidoreductase